MNDERTAAAMQWNCCAEQPPDYIKASSKKPCEMGVNGSTYMLHEKTLGDIDDYDTDEELNQKMQNLGSTESIASTDFHPFYQFYEKERHGSISSGKSVESVHAKMQVNPTAVTNISSKTTTPWVASDKIALIIANERYTKLPENQLRFPRKDAYDLSASLQRLGFKVISLVDLTLV